MLLCFPRLTGSAGQEFAYCLLPTANCQLPTAYFPLPTVTCLFIISTTYMFLWYPVNKSF